MRKCLSYNKLQSLPESFSEIIVGRDLGLYYNKLKSLPESFSEITDAGNVYLYEGDPIRKHENPVAKHEDSGFAQKVWIFAPKACNVHR